MSISWESILGADMVVDKQKQKESNLNIQGIQGLPLSVFEKRDLAVETYSEVLDCTIWLCSNNSMVRQIKQDNPGAVCYTTKELEKLIELNPKPDDIKNVNEAKKVFPGATIIETTTKEQMLDRVLSEMDVEFPADMYNWIDENDEELSTRITEAEEKVNELYKSGSVEEFKSALGEYKRLHGEAFNQMIKKRSKSK